MRIVIQKTVAIQDITEITIVLEVLVHILNLVVNLAVINIIVTPMLTVQGGIATPLQITPCQFLNRAMALEL